MFLDDDEMGCAVEDVMVFFTGSNCVPPTGFKRRPTASQGPHFIPHITAKLMIKAHFSERMVSSGLSDVVITSVYCEKTHLKKFMMKMIIIILNKSQETTFLICRQKLTSTVKLRPEK